MNVHSNDTLDKKYPDDYINGDVKPYSIHSVHIGLIFDHVGLSEIGNPPIWWFVIIFVQWIYLPISIFMRPHLQRPPANSEDGAFQAVGVPQIIQVISGLIIKAISSYRSLFFISWYPIIYGI